MAESILTSVGAARFHAFSAGCLRKAPVDPYVVDFLAQHYMPVADLWSKTLDKYPNLKVLVHHFGGIVPMLEGRLGPGWDVMGSRTTDEDYVALAMSCNCMTLRSCSFSRYSRPFLTLT